MAIVKINDTYLKDIAAAIREKTGTSTTYKPSEMAAAVLAIEAGSNESTKVTFTINIVTPDGEISSTRTETVDSGTTWDEWADTTYSDDWGGVLFYGNGMGIVMYDPTGNYLYDSNNNEVIGNTVIVEGVYYVHDGTFTPSSTILFSVDGKEYTVANGTTWGELYDDYSNNFTEGSPFSDYLTVRDGYVISQISDCVIKEQVTEKYVKPNMVIIATDYYDSGTTASEVIEETQITFSISEYDEPSTYTAEEGMTWKEWCESEYNTIGLFVTGDYSNVYREYDDENATGTSVAFDGIEVSADETIISNRQYHYYPF